MRYCSPSTYNLYLSHWARLRPLHPVDGTFGCGYDRYRRVDWTLVETRPWPGSISRVLVSPMFQPFVAISLDVTGARTTAVVLRVGPSRLVSPARC